MKSVASNSRIVQAQNTARELRALAGKLKRLLREKVGVEGLTLSQVAVLIHLERQGTATVSDLARAENVRPQSMRTTVASLQALGLVSGAPDPGDGRRTLLALTRLAHEKISTNRAAREDWLFHAILDRFSASEQDALARGVALLKRLAES
ncbi:MAG TPA: MarR family transcriptional regulator [Rhodanobacteraceae bacterium]|nr:MarR family transcriptional regulator [Rhodanobacteraceae bacterium]